MSGWMGGKSRLAKRIVALLPKHTCYCEPFCGAAWVLFCKEQSAAEVLNDINGELINLYRVVKHHLDEFIRYFRWILVSREEFERFQNTPPETMTDVQRATRFYYLQKCAFGGKVTGRTFGISATGRPRLNLLRIEEDLSAAHLRLARVTIERLGYQACIERYDRETTFFYLDPPYMDSEDVYGRGLFCRDDFAALAKQLATIRGKFLLSINDTVDARSIFSNFNIIETETTYSCSKAAPKRVRELFVSNYALPAPATGGVKEAA